MLVRLAPYSQTTLRYRVRLAGAPWPDTDYLPAFSAAIPYDGSVENPAVVHFSAPAFEVGGQSGVHVRLSSLPVRRKGHSYVTIRRGGRIAIVGETDPVLRRHPLRLTYRRSSAAGRIATVRTDDRGRFTYRWKPPTPGLYDVFVRYTSDEPALVSDTSCGLMFDAGRR